jgi:hypothetical protein
MGTSSDCEHTQEWLGSPIYGSPCTIWSGWTANCRLRGIGHEENETARLFVLGQLTIAEYMAAKHETK